MKKSQKTCRIFLSVTAVILVLSMMAFFAGCSNDKKQATPDTATTAATEQVISNSDITRNFDAKGYNIILENCVAQIKDKTDFKPEIILVLDSGFSSYTDDLEAAATIPYSEIKGFPQTSKDNEEGKLIFATIKGKKVVIMDGQISYYDGYTMNEVVLPIRVLHMLGADTVILTDDVGALNYSYGIGELFVAEDHISSFIPSPLIGENVDSLGERHVDMTNVYDETLRELVIDICNENDIEIESGTHLQVTGPQYETPSEVNMYSDLGDDIVSCNSVDSAIAAKHMGMRVCSVSCITNMGAGMEDTEISQSNISNEINKAGLKFKTLMDSLFDKMDKPESTQGND